MITELYGLPGAGKTTLAKKMAEEQGYTIVKIRKKSELIYYCALFLFKHPIKFFVQLFYLLKNFGNARLFYYKLMNVFLVYNAKYLKARRYEKALLDQGGFLNAFSLFEHPVGKEEMRNYFKYILKPDRLLVIDISFETSLERTDKRGYFAREDFDSEYREKWQKAVRANNRTFLEIVSGIGVFVKYEA